MLVYGDTSERADLNECLTELGRACADVRRMPRSLERHDRLVGVLIEGGRLLQGLADDDLAHLGSDRRTEDAAALTYFLVSVGTAVGDSWRGADFDLPDPPMMHRLRCGTLKQPEGYAFYALYPEAYAEAARRIALKAPPRVIGIRSIGASLGAVVAASVGARTFFTLRPVGNPSARELAVSPELERELLDGDAHFLIVDEGPGRSGSSFCAVADWLQERGVSLDHVTFLPSHGDEPGPEATDAHRALWRLVDKSVADWGARLPLLLERRVTDLLGELETPLVDVSAGAWRQKVYGSAADWPAAAANWDRRKFLARAAGKQWLVKFAGLGTMGRRKLEMARALRAHGLAPEPAGLVHGFLVECWHGGAARLQSGEKPIAEIAHYLATRARLFPAEREEGASMQELYVMARRNVALLLGDEAAAGLARWEPHIGSLERRVRRVRTDNRLDRHEWVRLADGRLSKTDGVDHFAAHDLIGAQDLAWDIAGATIEFGLSPLERAVLAAEVGPPVDPELLEFLLLAYPAFRAGQCRLAAESTAEAAERQRLQARTDGYLACLEEHTCPATRRESALA